mgnify:CR=1 FL=1
MSGKPKAGISYAGWNTDIFENDTKIDEPIKLKDGRVWTPADVVRNSQKSYGRSLCRDCMTKINEAKKAAKTAEQEG